MTVTLSGILSSHTLPIMTSRKQKARPTAMQPNHTLNNSGLVTYHSNEVTVGKYLRVRLGMTATVPGPLNRAAVTVTVTPWR